MDSPSMDIPRKKIIIGCTAAVAVLIVIVVVAIVVHNSKSQSVPDPKPTFEGCDGFPDPTDDIVIHSCPHGTDDGYCELEAGKDTNVTLYFTPSKWQFRCDQILF